MFYVKQCSSDCFFSHFLWYLSSQNLQFFIVGPRRTFWITLSVVLLLNVFYRGLQRDVVFLGWPIAPPYMSPNAEGGWGGAAGPQPWVQFYTGAQVNFGDLTTYLTYGFLTTYLLLRYLHSSALASFFSPPSPLSSPPLRSFRSERIHISVQGFWPFFRNSTCFM